jgi:hypothetical protein
LIGERVGEAGDVHCFLIAFLVIVAVFETAVDNPISICGVMIAWPFVRYG